MKTGLASASAALTLAASLHTVPARAASAAFQQAVLDDAPVLYFQLGESTGVAVNKGSFGSDFHADFLGTPLRQALTESGDRAVAFDSSDDFLETAAVAPESLAGNPTFTAEAIYFLPPDGGVALWAPFLHWGDSSSSPTMKSVYFSFQHDNPQRLYAGFYNGGLRTTQDVSRGAWHHVVWVRTGGGAANAGTTLYVDGTSVALENDPDLPADSATPNVVATAFRIDRAQDITRWFRGSLDEVALYDRALGADEVQAHYAAIEHCAAERCIDYDGGCKICGLPASSGSGGSGTSPLASDALAVLRAAVGSRKCNGCICDVDESGNIVASDALVTLKKAVGQGVALHCPAAG